MLGRTRARLRRRRGRLAIVCAVALLGASVATAHTSVATEHMGEAAAMCLAILAGGAAVAALRALALQAPLRRAPLALGGPGTLPRLEPIVPYAARGDPAVLQVFRR
jgi:peptidoglycan/LPS O-acetylase OafA/YrhL